MAGAIFSLTLYSDEVENPESAADETEEVEEAEENSYIVVTDYYTYDPLTGSVMFESAIALGDYCYFDFDRSLFDDNIIYYFMLSDNLYVPSVYMGYLVDGRWDGYILFTPEYTCTVFEFEEETVKLYCYYDFEGEDSSGTIAFAERVYSDSMDSTFVRYSTHADMYTLNETDVYFYTLSLSPREHTYANTFVWSGEQYTYKLEVIRNDAVSPDDYLYLCEVEPYSFVWEAD